MASLNERQQRLIYLITYSRANTAVFSTKQSFADAVIEAWRNAGVRLQHWVVSMEAHAISDSEHEMNEYHYHMAVKLTKKARWLQARNYLDHKFGIKVHFSDLHNTYYSAYRYVTKEDQQPCHSHNHPDLSTRPRTENAIAARKRKSGQSKSKGKKKSRRERGLTVYEVSQVIEKKNITKRGELVCLDVGQKREGNTRLAEFIANRGAKAVDEALSVGKEFREAEAKAMRAKKTRIELLLEAKGSTCADQCKGQWLEAALELMRLNRIDVSAFCTAVYNALQNGRGKYQNIFIYGPADCGKTFILSPLKCIYHVFCNPATGTFAWLGVDEAEVILLNDFRWNPVWRSEIVIVLKL